jgi:hypothetical protein
VNVATKSVYVLAKSLNAFKEKTGAELAADGFLAPSNNLTVVPEVINAYPLTE